MDKEDSCVDFGLTRSASNPLNSSLYYISLDNISTSYKSVEDETVNYFYKAMLKVTVAKTEEILPDTTESIPSGDRVFINANLDYIQMCEDEEFLEKKDDYNVTNEATSDYHDFIKRVPSKRRTTSSRSLQSNDYFTSKANVFAPKKDKRLRRRSNKSRKKLTTSRSSTAPKNTAIDTSSQLKYDLDPEFEEHVVIKFRSGNIYTGPTYMKMFHGFGEYRWTDGTVYKGHFFKGEMTGSGKFSYTDLSTYEGETYKGYRHGFGKYFLKRSTSAYSGNWHLGMRQGTGCINFDYNNWYEGSWKSDFIDGFGIRHYSSGSKHQGEFVAGKRSGNGFTLFWNNDIYKGNWKEGKRSGYGQYIWKPYHDILFCIPALNTYKGMWKNDCMHGRGELNFGTVNGSRYIGHFSYNLKHGGGLAICENGFVFNCTFMFADNKPVQYFTKREPKSLEHDASTLSAIQEIMKEENNSIKPKNRQKTNVLNKRTRATMNLCKYQFTRKPEKCISIKIPIWVPAENINLKPFILNLFEVIHEYNTLETSESFIAAPKTWEEAGVEMKPQPHLKYGHKEIYNIEEKALRRAIHINLRRLREIYKHYSLVGCLKDVPYDTLMNRLFLWQMLRDCKISEKGLSLTNIDVLLAEGSFSLSKSIHDPFENIYFWQFLTILVKTAWEIYGSKTVKYIYEGRSILEKIFTQFLVQDVFPNAGRHLGCALFDYKDILPIKAVYNWYKSIQEPMTIKTLVLNIFSLDKKETFSYEPIPKEFYVKNGTNISVGSDIVFLAEEEPKYGLGPKTERVVPNETKCAKKKLYFLRELGARLIYKKIKTVVPGIFIKQECFNHEYKLCFLEFYEILLICTQAVLRRKEFKLKKKVTKISEVNENAILKAITATSKKSKQYRKSASHHSIAKRHVS